VSDITPSPAHLLLALELSTAATCDCFLFFLSTQLSTFVALPPKPLPVVLLNHTDTTGRLVKATRLKGIQGFKAGDFGLHPIAVSTWGHLVFLHLQGGAGRAAGGQQEAPPPPNLEEWLGGADWDTCRQCVSLLPAVSLLGCRDT
jgi:hypothetical protein